MKISHPAFWPLILVITMAFWAGGYAFLKPIANDIDPVLLGVLRFFFAGIVLLPLLSLQKQRTLPPRREWLPLALLSLANVLPTPLLAISIERTSIAVSSILVNTNPLWVALLAPFLISEHLTWRQRGCVAIGFVGVLLVILNGQNPWTLIQSDYFLGSLILLISAIDIALFSIFVKRYVERYGGLYVTTINVTVGSLLLLLISIVQGNFWSIAEVSLRTIWFCMLLGILSTALPYMIWNSSMQHLKASVAASYKLLIPIFSTILATLLFQETISIWIILGMAMTSVGIYAVHRGEPG
ncbi:MAG: DMT family transporter [bacterium]|nr:DMT family transporter [bacterium]